MVSWRVVLAATLLALPLWLAELTPVHACTCGPGTFEDQVRGTDLILVGVPGELRLTEVLPATPQPESPPTGVPSPYDIPDADVEWTVDVEEYIKGSGPDPLTVESATHATIYPDGSVDLETGTNPLCGFAPESGVRYLLFLGQRDADRYETSACSYNYSITQENEADVLALIEQIRQILQGPAPTATVSDLPPLGSGGGGSGGSPWALVGAAGVGALLAATALLTLGRRAR